MFLWQGPASSWRMNKCRQNLPHDIESIPVVSDRLQWVSATIAFVRGSSVKALTLYFSRNAFVTYSQVASPRSARALRDLFVSYYRGSRARHVWRHSCTALLSVGSKRNCCMSRTPVLDNVFVAARRCVGFGGDAQLLSHDVAVSLSTAKKLANRRI